MWPNWDIISGEARNGVLSNWDIIGGEARNGVLPNLDIIGGGQGIGCGLLIIIPGQLVKHCICTMHFNGTFTVSNNVEAGVQ